MVMTASFRVRDCYFEFAECQFKVRLRKLKTLEKIHIALIIQYKSKTQDCGVKALVIIDIQTILFSTFKKCTLKLSELIRYRFFFLERSVPQQVSSSAS